MCYDVPSYARNAGRKRKVMYCRFCGKKIPDELDTCVACGKENVFLDVTEAKVKRKKTFRLIAFILAAVILLGLVAGGIYHLISHIVWLNRPEDIYYYNDYSISAEKMAEKAGTVVATIGDEQLTNARLQIFYWMFIYSFADTYYDEIESYGLNLLKPYADQTYSKETGMNWQQYFLQEALNLWTRYIAISKMAEADNFVLPEDVQAAYDGIDASIKEAAEKADAESVDAFLQTEMGPGITLDDYKYYLMLHYTASSYYSELQEKQEPLVTEAEIDAWYKENRTMLKNTYNVTKDTGDIVAVRHILLKVDTTGKDSDGKSISTDEDWANCQSAAQAILDEFLANDPTEEKFGELAKKHSADTGSAKNGGLFTGITKETNFVEPFLSWCMDDTREVGDTGLVKSTFGYHIMYFVSGEPAWIMYSRAGVLNEKCAAMVDTAMKEGSATVDYTKLAIADFLPVQ